MACTLFLAMLAGCGATTRVLYPLKTDAAYPFDDFFFADMKLPDRALVVVGAFGDEALDEFEQTQFGLFLGHWIIPTSGRKFNEVYIVPVTVGKDFSISSAKVAPNPNTKSRWGEARVDFSQPKTIRIDRPGIYYYGKIIFNNGKAYMANDIDNAVIDLAVKRHPKVFSGELPRINF